MKKILWAGAGLVAGVCMFACGDSSSSTSFEIPSYKNEAALPDSCSMEVAKVDTAYFACFENKWVEVKDSAIVEQLKEGLDEEEVKAKLEELEELLKADTPATPAKPKSSSSEETDEDVESSDSEEPESSDSEEEECTGRHCKDNDSGSGSGSGSGKSSSSNSGSTSEEVKCVENGFKPLEDYVTWTSSNEGNRVFYGKKALVKKCAGDAKGDVTALKNNLQHDTRYQCFAVTSLTDEGEELYGSLSMVFEVEVKVGDFVCEGIFSETVYAITLLKTETASSKFYAASAEMSGSTDEGSSSSEGDDSSSSEGDDDSSASEGSSTSVEESSSSEAVESSASVEESSSSVEEGEPCGDTTYDPETQYCKDGVVKSIKFTVSRSQIYVDGDSTRTSLSVEDALDCDISWTNGSSVRRMSSINNNCAWIFSNNNSDKETKPVVVTLTSVDYGPGAVVPNGVTANINVFGTAWGRLSRFSFLDSYVKWSAYTTEMTSGRKLKTSSKARANYSCKELIGFESVKEELLKYDANSSGSGVLLFVLSVSGLESAMYFIEIRDVKDICEITAGVESSFGRI